ncbi:CDGSH iron-sulfur domain-containing protein [Candidatus Bathyarchaeota archaeon]|nr:CDGSH iron-sulfur domain-containing protein [Candidatus Bathyarchaeota archaeon]
MKKKNDSLIETKEDGPYVGSDVLHLKTSKGEQVKITKTIVLCRCGKSSAKPFCDGTHNKVNFKSAKIDGRQPDRLDDYVGQGITIYDNRGVCSHIGYCTDNLPSVFRMGQEPWIDPEGAFVDEIIKVINMCPSGALSYSIHGVKHDSLERKLCVSLRRDGPYHIVGGINLSDYNKSKPESKEHYTLCRCGGSKNKPFCDGTHWYIKFKDDESNIPLENCREVTIEEYLGNLKRSEDDFEEVMKDIHQMSVSGKSIVEPMRTKKHVISWNDILIKGAQLAKTPLNDDVPVSTKTIIGPKAKKPLIIQTPIYVTHMSFGALSKEIKIALAKGSSRVKTAIGSGEGGLVEESLKNSYKYIFEYVPNKYSATDENLKRVDAVEIKIGQSAKPGMGGHLPGKKVTSEIGKIRGYPTGSDIISPAHFDDINNRDELKLVVDTLRKKTDGKPIGIKIAAGNIEADLEIALSSNPDFVTVDGRPGATASALKTVKDSTSLPTIFALYRAKKYFDENNIKDVSLIITGGLRLSSDFVKALAMGADAIAIGTAALMAVACQQYRICDTGDCPVGVTTQKSELITRVTIEHSAKKLENFLRVSTEEIKTFVRLTGNKAVTDLNRNDLFTVNTEISRYTDIEHA